MRCPIISDRGRFQMIGTSVYTLPVGLLQCSAGRNSWHPGETASISPEHCSSVSLWCSMLGPYHTSPAQPALASSVAEDLFQDHGPCMEIHDVAPAYLQEVCLPVESVPGRPHLRSASTGCVELPRMLMSTGQRSFSFHDPTVWNSLLSALPDGSLSLNMFSWQLKAYLFG